MPSDKVTRRIKDKALELLEQFPKGLRYSELHSKISEFGPNFNLFGIGLVTFDATAPAAPDFRILARAARHEPDLFYTNKYMALIEKELFS